MTYCSTWRQTTHSCCQQSATVFTPQELDNTCGVKKSTVDNKSATVGTLLLTIIVGCCCIDNNSVVTPYKMRASFFSQ